MSQDQQWRSEEDKRMDLELDNQAMEQDLKLRFGAGEFHTSEDIDPKLHNAFLNSVEAWEELDTMPKRPLRSIFPKTYEFPPVDSMSDQQVADKLDDICEYFEANNIQLGFREEVPDRLVYKHLVEDVIPHDEIMPENNFGFNTVLDGCTGGCQDCFQKDYCETGKEEN